MKITLNEFKGIMPKVANDKLPPNMAQMADDLKTSSGEIRALRRSTSDVELDETSYKTFFEYLEGGQHHWVYYDLIVHWVRSPTSNDSFERMYITGADAVNGKYKAFVNDIQGGGDFDFTTDFYFPGANSGTAPALVVSAGSDYVAYFYTYVSRYGEEGPPSAIADNAAATDDTRNQVNDIESVPAADDHLDTIIDGEIPKVFLYRTVGTGIGAAAFLLVLEAEWFDTGQDYAVGDYVIYQNDIWECTSTHVAAAWDGGHFTQGENVLDADTGPVCSSIFYDRAPDDLTNLRGCPGGFFVASKNNTLYFSEPFAPWAWPEDYQIPIDQEIIGIGVYGSTIVVATDGHIYTFSGPHPTSLYKTKLNFQPCLSQRALVETDEGVMFPSLEGFQHVTSGGVANITAQMFDPEDWVNLEVETMHGTWYNKAYYGFYKSSDYQGYILIDTLNGAITTGVAYHWAGHVSLQSGKFKTIYSSDIADPTTLFISSWDSDATAYDKYTYKSPLYVLEKPANFKVAQVILDEDFVTDLIAALEESSVLEDLNQTAWDLGDRLRAPFNDFMFNEQSINGDTLFSLSSLGIQEYINFKVFVGGELKFTKQVDNCTMFKLPRGFRHKKWEWSVDGMIPIKRVTIATSTEEIV